jgi:hypothetical protein
MGRNAKCRRCGVWDNRSAAPIAVGNLWNAFSIAYENTQALKRVSTAVITHIGRRVQQPSKGLVPPQSLFFTRGGRRTKTEPGKSFAEVLHEGLGIINL